MLRKGLDRPSVGSEATSKLDYHLSSSNGVELYDQLYAMEGLEAIPAILLSASVPQETLNNGIKQRHLVAIIGPHDLDDLLHTIEGAFNEPSKGRGSVPERGGYASIP